MRVISRIAVVALSMLPGVVLAQTTPSPSATGSPVVGLTGPVYVPDPQPRSVAQTSTPSTSSNNSSRSSGQGGSRGGHHGHRGGLSGNQTPDSNDNPAMPGGPNG
jgi:hypothetical protein